MADEQDPVETEPRRDVARLGEPVETESPEPAPVVAPAGFRFPYGIAAIAGLIILAGVSSPWWLPAVKPLFQQDASVTSAAETPRPIVETPSAPPPAASASDDELATRVDRLEGAIRGLRSSSDGAATKSDLAALRSQLEALAEKLDAAPAAPQAQAEDPRRLDAVAEQLKQISARLAAAETRLAQRQTDSRDDRALVLAASQITDALATSGPYEVPVNAIRSAAPDDPAVLDSLAVLEKHDKTGLPSRVQLAQDLAELPRQFGEPAETDPNAGFWDRAKTSVERLVSVRRIDDPAATPTAPPGPDRIVSDARLSLAGGDLDGAVKLVRRLDGHAADVAKTWIATATARLEAEGAARSLQAALAQRLAEPAPDRP